MIKQTVEDILKQYPETRDNDFLLCMHTLVRLGYAYKGHKSIKINLENLEDMPSFETITRLRREIQNNEQRLKASQDVREQRRKQEITFHTRYSKSLPNSWMSE